jgi:membrane-bound metal-dependent hydrolase YbcI (DUF457 family)
MDFDRAGKRIWHSFAEYAYAGVIVFIFTSIVTFILDFVLIWKMQVLSGQDVKPEEA